MINYNFIIITYLLNELSSFRTALSVNVSISVAIVTSEVTLCRTLSSVFSFCYTEKKKIKSQIYLAKEYTLQNNPRNSILPFE